MVKNTKNISTTKNVSTSQKTESVVTTKDTKTTEVKNIPVVSNQVANNNIILTVVVLDENNKPKEGAKVSITPADARFVTDSNGEAKFTLSNDNKYQITASYGLKKATVPYYVTKDGATKLVVSPTYVRQVERQIQKEAILKSPFTYVGLGIGVIVIIFVIWVIFKRKKRARKQP